MEGVKSGFREIMRLATVLWGDGEREMGTECEVQLLGVLSRKAQEGMR